MKVTFGFKYTESTNGGKTVRFIPIYRAECLGKITRGRNKSIVSDIYTTVEEAREEARKLSLLHPYSKKGFTVFNVATWRERVENEPIFVNGKEVQE